MRPRPTRGAVQRYVAPAIAPTPGMSQWSLAQVRVMPLHSRQLAVFVAVAVAALPCASGPTQSNAPRCPACIAMHLLGSTRNFAGSRRSLVHLGPDGTQGRR